MSLLPKLILIFVVILHGDFITGNRLVGAAVNRTNEIKLIVAAGRTLLSTTASQDQLNQLKKDIPRCLARNPTVIQSLFNGNLLQLINTILNPIGRRKREAAIGEQQNAIPIQSMASKDPQTRAQDISTILTQVTKMLNKLPSDKLVYARKVTQGIAGNMLLRGPFLIAAVLANTACANGNTSG